MCSASPILYSTIKTFRTIVFLNNHLFEPPKSLPDLHHPCSDFGEQYDLKQLSKWRRLGINGHLSLPLQDLTLLLLSTLIFDSECQIAVQSCVLAGVYS
ncbi:hypothetical protein L195_g022117 [Trifolium pratense]|uniref:Uncharacterized protein n=1 Tax=Trifolium pratense TaxID=57577 RepID=A0A2K3N797_TRIPR|nr:hypothetical protein L195_g022117 [Trifolium pratense]